MEMSHVQNPFLVSNFTKTFKNKGQNQENEKSKPLLEFCLFMIFKQF